ncbi:MAG: TatD family hydrolase [Candidatus Bathyarchaeia archaeon]
MEDVADAHAHLADMEGLKDVVQRAYKAGVYAILAVGMGYQSNQRTLKIAESLVNSPVKILPSLGLHPCGLSEAEIESTIAHMRRNMISARAVGEVGLDYWLKDVRKDDYSKRVQERAFREAVRLARDFDKPVVVHSRGAWDEYLRILV